MEPLAIVVSTSLRGVSVPINDPDEREAMASANPFRLWALSHHPSAQVRELVAQNAATPPDALVFLISGGNPYVREAALRHPHIASEVVLRAWKVSDLHAKADLVEWEHCPPDLLTDALAQTESLRLRWVSWSQIVDEPLGSAKFEEVMRPLWPDDDFVDIPREWIAATFGF